jgi:DNA polymerase elongation subunit (family B)
MSQETISLNELVPSAYERLVATELNADGTATLFQRLESGEVKQFQIDHRSWLLLAEPRWADSLEGVLEVRKLAGEAYFGWLVSFKTVAECLAAQKVLRQETGFSATQAGAPYRVFNDSAQQVLSLLPARLFRGLKFQDLRRLQLDIETRTTPGYDFPNASREGDEIIIVSLRDSTGWECCLSRRDLSEPELLREMMRLVRERDPDVLEGHNLFNFDLPYIQERCKRYKLPLKMGRDNKTVRARSSRFTAGEQTLNYTRFDLYGRQVVDTLHLTRLYDVIHRDLESYSLKAVARYFGVAAPERTYVEGSQISKLFDSDPERLHAYAMDDVRETDAISQVLSPSYFYQTQLVPFSYQNCVARGNATRIDALLVAMYLAAGQSLPVPEAARSFQGGLTDSPECGVFHNVWHADVRSLYPSIIVGNHLSPKNDSLKIYLKLLTKLREFRLAAKDAMRKAPTPEERGHYDALQSTFKILINSFYGYVGFGMGTFNDFDMAETVTSRGREVLTTMLNFLRSCGSTVVEMDTDGLYFVPPKDVTEPKTMEKMIQAELPPGIDVELDATYKAMFAYKSKNYALLEQDDKVSVTGAALKSRGLEPFQRRYIHELITRILQGTPNGPAELYERYARDIEQHALPLADFAKREALSGSPQAYKEKLAAKKTRRSAAYELALKATREYKQGDQVAFYITGTKKSVTVADSARLLSDADPAVRDENTAYYQEKLAKLHQKLTGCLPSAPDSAQGVFTF